MCPASIHSIRHGEILLFYTIGRVPVRMATDLHDGLVQRQPPPRRFRIPFDDTPRIFAAHAGTQTNHGTLQPCAGTSVASVHLYKAGASQYINSFVLPLSYSAQKRPLSQAYAPCGCEARGHAYGADGWARTNDIPPGAVLYRLSYVCILPRQGGAAAPPHRGEKRGKEGKRNESARAGCPCISSIPICISPAHPSNENFFIFLLFPLDIPRNAW